MGGVEWEYSWHHRAFQGSSQVCGSLCSLQELVKHEENGLVFEDAEELAGQLQVVTSAPRQGTELHPLILRSCGQAGLCWVWVEAEMGSGGLGLGLCGLGAGRGHHQSWQLRPGTDSKLSGKDQIENVLGFAIVSVRSTPLCCNVKAATV